MHFKVDILSEIKDFERHEADYEGWHLGVQKGCGVRGIPLPDEREWAFLHLGFDMGDTEFESVINLIDWRRS